MNRLDGNKVKHISSVTDFDKIFGYKSDRDLLYIMEVFGVVGVIALKCNLFNKPRALGKDIIFNDKKFVVPNAVFGGNTLNTCMQR